MAGGSTKHCSAAASPITRSVRPRAQNGPRRLALLCIYIYKRPCIHGDGEIHHSGPAGPALPPVPPSTPSTGPVHSSTRRHCIQITGDCAPLTGDGHPWEAEGHPRRAAGTHGRRAAGTRVRPVLIVMTAAAERWWWT